MKTKIRALRKARCISHEALHSMLETKMSLDKLHNIAIKRVDYILRKIFTSYGHKYSFCDWWFGNAMEGTRGSIFDGIEKDAVEFDYYYKKEPCHCIIKNEIWELSSCFPLRWLWEDFEKELLDGKNAYKKYDDGKHKK